MLKIIKRLFPVEMEGKVNRLQSENEELKNIINEQAEALIEIAEIITEGE